MRRNGWLEAVRVDPLVGKVAAGGLDERERIGIAQPLGGAGGPGGHRFHDRHAAAERAQSADECARDDRLADVGVGAGDENAARAHGRPARPIEPGAMRATPPIAGAARRPAAPQQAP